MRTCPACNSQYSDETLVFCLQDGTRLVGAAQRDTPTVVLGETETVARGSGGMQFEPSQVTHVSPPRTAKRGSNTAIAVVLTALGMLLVFGVIGLASWILWLQPGPTTANIDNRNTNAAEHNANVVPTPTSTPTGTPVNTNVRPTTNISAPPPATPATNASRSGSEVSTLILDHWKNSLESGDLNRHMSGYAPTVDYYRRRGASSDFVRADKARAFNRYSAMRVNISNMDVTVDPAGDAATATFDKEWTFSGRGTNTGKVRSELRFRLIGGRWLLVGERDVRVYYTR